MQQKIYNFTDALKQLAKVIEMRENDKTVWIQRGLVFQDMGNHELAIEDFNKAIEIDQDYSKSWFHRGTSKLQSAQLMRSQKKSDKVKEALEDFKEAERLDEKEENPATLDVIWDGLGCCYHKIGDFEQAIENFSKAIDKSSESIEFYKNRSQCYFDMEDYENSIADLKTGLEYNSKDPQVLYKLGLTYFAYKKYKQCTKYMKQALKHRPFLTYEADIYYHLGLAYCRMEKFEKSIFPYSRCIERIPSDLRYRHERAKAYQMIGHHEEAVEDFNEVIKKNPKNAHAHFRRAFSLKALGPAHNPNVSIFSQTCNRLDLQNYLLAADDFEKAKNLDPLNPDLVINHKKLKGITCIVLCEPGEEKEF